jgi:glycosyltransferase involved in cell wall biosynthesis
METPRLPPTRPDGSHWPSISIVTPSYNQGQFIEETIRSVLLQGYSDLEYIIIDGGSTDQSVEIIKRYESWLGYWISEKDRGQSHAINKGFAVSCGEIFQWLNSDDFLLPGATREIGLVYEGAAIATSIFCGCSLERATQRPNRRLSIRDVLTGKAVFSQPGLWLPKKNLLNLKLDEQLHYAFDWDLLLRYLENHRAITYTRVTSVFFRLHADSKTVSNTDAFRREGHLILARLSHSFKEAENKKICKRELQRRNWQRRLSHWCRCPENVKNKMAWQMIVLAFRRPEVRINRFWLGAVRRALAAR